MDLDIKAQALRKLKDERSAAHKEYVRIGEAITELEVSVQTEMNAAKLEMARAGGYTISLVRSVVPTVEDWDAVYQYIAQNDAAYLLERRVAVKAWRELRDSGVDVPGTAAFDKVGVSLRKAPKK